MDDAGVISFFMAICFGFGVFGGYMMGDYDRRIAIIECQKQLPRDVYCKIIAVPVDRN